MERSSRRVIVVPTLRSSESAVSGKWSMEMQATVSSPLGLFCPSRVPRFIAVQGGFCYDRKSLVKNYRFCCIRFINSRDRTITEISLRRYVNFKHHLSYLSSFYIQINFRKNNIPRIAFLLVWKFHFFVIYFLTVAIVVYNYTNSILKRASN